MNKRILAILLALPSMAQAQSANDLVQAWLANAGKPGVVAGYSTCSPSPTPVVGSDGICSWNATALGTQPTVAQLQAMASAWTAQQSAKTAATAALQTYSAQIAKGLTVVCASNATICTSDLAGTYTVPVVNQPPTPANSAAQNNITSIETSIAAGRGLPGGGSTFSYFDVSGTAHSFSSAAWAEFATAMRDYSYALQVALITAQAGGTPSWPSTTVTLN